MGHIFLQAGVVQNQFSWECKCQSRVYRGVTRAHRGVISQAALPNLLTGTQTEIFQNIFCFFNSYWQPSNQVLVLEAAAGPPPFPILKDVDFCVVFT